MYFDALSLQQLTQLLYFLLQLADQFGIGIFVDDSFADDLLRSVCIPVKTNRSN